LTSSSIRICQTTAERGSAESYFEGCVVDQVAEALIVQHYLAEQAERHLMG